MPLFGGAKKNAAAAQRLDAADGVMDGRYFGNPIVQGGRKGRGPPQVVGAGYGGYGGYGAPGALVPYAGAPAAGYGYGYGAARPGYFPAAATGYYGGYAGAVPVGAYGVNSAAAALDAADGVIDGRFHGRPIVGAGAAPVVAAGYGGYASPVAYGGAFPATFGATVGSSALALDAADGVIDGRYHGRPIVQAGVAAPVTYGAAVAAPVTYGATAFPSAIGAFPGYAATPAFPTAFGASSSALALDAADGVIDGRYHGRPIVQAGAPVAAFGATTFGAYPSTVAYGGAFPTAFGAGSSALALDAADGVIDGRYHGRPIVQAGVAAPMTYGAAVAAPVTYGATAFPTAVGGFPGYFGGVPSTIGNPNALALDAADGVIDGRFHGRPIIG